jgi:hypothetical protein
VCSSDLVYLPTSVNTQFIGIWNATTTSHGNVGGSLNSGTLPQVIEWINGSLISYARIFSVVALFALIMVIAMTGPDMAAVAPVMIAIGAGIFNFIGWLHISVALIGLVFLIGVITYMESKKEDAVL